MQTLEKKMYNISADLSSGWIQQVIHVYVRVTINKAVQEFTSYNWRSINRLIPLPLLLEQIGLESAKFLLTSTASLEYDTNQYIFSGLNNKPPVRKVSKHNSVLFVCVCVYERERVLEFESKLCSVMSQIQAEIEVYSKPDFTKEIIGGSLGGLVLLVLITAGLYKVKQWFRFLYYLWGHTCYSRSHLM